MTEENSENYLSEIHEERIQKMSTSPTLKAHIRKILEEQKQFLNEADIADTPARSTAVNKLASVLKIIIPTIESSYKALTTSKEQRESFKKFYLKAVLDSLAPQDMLVSDSQELQETVIKVQPTKSQITSSTEDIVEPLSPLNEIDEFETQKDPSKFIDVTGEDDRKKKEAEKEQQNKEKKQEKLKLAHDEKASKPFPEIPNLDLTGRDESIDCYKKTIDAIIRSYRRLHDPEDIKVFKNFLITNLLLYMDKFESDISQSLPDVTTPEYEKQKADIASFSPSENGGNPLQESLSAQILKSLQNLKIV